MDVIEQLEKLRFEIDPWGYDSTEKQRQQAYYGNEMLDKCLEIVWKWIREHHLELELIT